ncbi:MAG TPA: DUF3943 domain-containing protein [Chitinophagaceae bacterium]
MKPGEVKFFSEKLPRKSPPSRRILFSDSGYYFRVTPPFLRHSSGILFYPWQKQTANPALRFQYKVAGNEQEPFPYNHYEFRTPPVNNLISFKGSRDPLLRNENAGVWKKIGRAELFIGGAELLCMGILMLMPKEVTKWSNDWVQDSWRNIKRAFTTAPVWDKDDWPLNYIGHPIAGSYYYNAVRSQNANWFHSFLFSTAQSFIWEYIIEGAAEKPSAQDLIITPVAGTMLGEATHQITMNMRRNGFRFFEKVFVLIFNPFFVLNNGFGPKFNPVWVRH